MHAIICRIQKWLNLKASTFDATRKKRTVKRKIDFTAKYLTPPDHSTRPRPTPSPNQSTLPPSSPEAGPSTSRSSIDNEDWVCGVCKGSYSADVKKRNGANWISCSFCATPYHENCQGAETDMDIFMCDRCANLNDSDSDDE